MKVVHVTDTLIAGGAERVAVDLANELFLRNIGVFFVTTRSGGELENKLNQNIGYACLFRKSTWDLDGINCFRNYIKKNNINFIHAHGNSTSMFCVIALLGIKNVKIIHHDHNSLLYNRRIIREKLLLKHVYRWIAVSDAIAEWASKVGHKNIIVLKNPINLNRFNLQPKEHSQFVNFGLIANYRVEKDYDVLLKAISLLKIRLEGAKSKITFNCYGNHYFSDYANHVKKMTEQLTISDLVKLNPPSENIPKILSIVDIGILCSKSEGLPISLLEYMASGLPVIVTNTGEMGVIVKKANCGLVVDVGNHKQLAEAILHILENKEHWEQWGKNGREYVQKYHSVESVVDELINKVYTSETC